MKLFVEKRAIYVAIFLLSRNFLFMPDGPSVQIPQRNCHGLALCEIHCCFFYNTSCDIQWIHSSEEVLNMCALITVA